MSTPPITPTQVSAPPIRPPQAEGFLGGVYDVVGPQLAAAQEDERRQKLAEQDFYFQRLHDPNLSVQPGDTPEVQDTKRRQLQVALDEYTKRSPKQAKPMVQTLGQLLTHLHGHGPQGATAPGAPGSATPVGPGAAAATPGPPPGAMATPPFLSPKQSAAATASLPSAGASPAIPPPPQAAAAPSAAGPAIPPPPNAADMAATSRAGQTSFDLATKNTAEKNQLAAVLASHQQGELAEPGIIRQQLDEIAKLPQEQQLPAMMKLGMFPASMLRPVTKLVPNDPNNPAAGAHYESYSPLAAMMGGGEGPAGFTPGTFVGKQTTTTDPFGNVTTSVRKPITGSTGAGAGAGGAGSASPKAGTGSITGRVMAVPPPLDQDGHIPAVQGVNPQLIENANRLLDGEDVNKLPLKARYGAGALARKYGWEQGKFTPKEQTQVREASTFIQQAMQDQNALSALDGDTLSRLQLSQVTSPDPTKEGMFGRGLSLLSAQNMDPKQTAFVQMYNQLVGTIAGLSKLVRPGGTTEAQIERLKSELPNPVTTKNSADARVRLQRLQKEIDIAMAKGNFGQLGAVNTAAPSGRPASIPAPPSGGKKQFYRLNGKFYDAQTQQEIPSQGAAQ